MGDGATPVPMVGFTWMLRTKGEPFSLSVYEKEEKFVVLVC